MKDLTIEITDRCSLNCAHCSTDSKNDGQLFLELGKIDESLEEFADFGKVRLSGGEPFEHPLICDMAKKIKEKEKIVEIISSGVSNKQELQKESLKKIKNFVDKIVFSIYGEEEIHNKVCGFDSYSLLKKSIESVMKEEIPFSFQTVAVKMNKEDIESIIKYISKIKERVNYCNPKLHILRFIKQGRGLRFKQFSISREEIDELMNQCKELSTKYSVDITFGCSLKERGCIQGSGKAAVTIQGEKISCSALKHGSKQKEFACKERW